MGLDLYHLKPCAAPADKSTGISFSLEELAEINTPAAFLEKHQHLLAQVSVPPDIFSICVLASEQQQRVFEQQFGKHDNWRLLTGTMESLAPVIYEIETEKELGAARQTIIEGHVNDGTDYFDYLMIQYRTVYPEQRLLYFEECGYQRKQMTPAFYEYFTNDKLYFSIDEVLLAYQYIEPWKGSEEATFRNFKENFIDSFEGGISVFMPSW